MIRKVWRKITAVIVIMSFSTLEIGLAQPLPVGEVLQGILPEKKVQKTPERSSDNQDGFFVPDSLSFLESDNPLAQVTDVSAEKIVGSASLLGGKDLQVKSAVDDNSEIRRLSHEFQQAQNDNVVNARRPERVSFEDALEELRPEYATAVIVDALTVENLKQLLALPIEIAILAIHGEIVLVTSGSEDEIGVLPAARQLIEEASFMSHTHPGIYSAEGPSGQDINEAVEAAEMGATSSRERDENISFRPPREEYVVTHRGVYAYNRDGLLNHGEAQDYEWYLTKLQEALSSPPLYGDKDKDVHSAVGVMSSPNALIEDQDSRLRGNDNGIIKNDASVAARAALNQFIAEQDQYNKASDEDRVTLRRGGTLSYTSGLTSSSVTPLPGTPYPYITAGSSAATTLSVSTNQFALGYSVPGTNDISGFTVSFDNASTAIIETQNLSTQTYLTFGLKGPNTTVKLEVIDINGVKDTFTLTNVVNTAERFWKIPVSSISNTLDKTKIKQLNFIVAQANTTSTTRTGTLYIRSSGLNTNVPATPAVSASPPAVNTATYTLSGTKEANTAILIGGVQVVARNSATTWSATVTLATEGNNTFSITAKNSIGKVSAAVSAIVKKDTIAPTGSLNINSSALYASSQAVTLNLSSSDGVNLTNTMSFSTDNLTWSTPEVYAVSRAFTLPTGDGSKTVYVKYYDKAGNSSPVYSKSIILDTVAPTGTVRVNAGVTAVKQTAVTLNLTAADAGSGLDKMSFSSDNVTWTTAETFAATKAWSFSAGDGNKTVHVKFLDKSGKWSTSVSTSVILDRVIPTGTININSGAAFTKTPTITLTLTAADTGSGIDRMSISSDNVTWTAVETFTATKSFTLPAGDGSKTVYVKYFDKAGNVSAVSSKTITLDTTPPTGSLLISGGALSTDSRAVILDLTAMDTLSGIDLSRVSVDGGMTWGVWETWTAKKNVSLPEGLGLKEVRHELRDKAGNIKQLAASISVVNPAPQIIFTSPSTTTSKSYTLTYKVDGEDFSETWQLAKGENDLLVRTAGSSPQFAKFKVTYDQSFLGPIYVLPFDGLGPLLPMTVDPEELIHVTTQDGLVLRYYEDKIAFIEKSGEYTLSRPYWNDKGELIGGVLEYDDGESLTFKQSRVVEGRLSDGTRIFYDETGKSTTAITTDSKAIRFAYCLDANGQVIRALSMDETADSLYEGNKPVWIMKKDGAEIRYTNGLLLEYRDSVGNQYRYRRTEIKIGAILTGYRVELTEVVRPGYAPVSVAAIFAQPSPYASLLSVIQNNLALTIEYDSMEEMTRFVSGKNEELNLDNQLPVSLRDASGHIKFFEPLESAQGRWNQITVTESGLSQSYGPDGKVVGLKLLGWGGTVLMQDTKLSQISLEDGSVLKSIQWDGENLTDFVRTLADGTVETYQAGHVISRKETNGNITAYFFDTDAGEDKPGYLTTSDGRTYHTIDFKNSAGLTDRITELVKVDLPDGGKVEFENGKPVRFIESKEIHFLAADVPNLPQGQAFIPLYETANLTFRSLRIDASGAILAGEILFRDGTQYFVEEGALIKQVTPDGKIIEIDNVKNEPLPVANPVLPQGYSAQELTYRDDLINKQLDYFISGVGIDPKTGFPMDNYDAATGKRSTYSQATLVGMWAEILSAIALGHFVTSKISKDQALQKLDQMLLNLCEVQKQAGWNGMVSFFGVSEETRPILDAQGKPTGQNETVSVYKRQFNDIGLGDNLNLSVSLNSVIGAIGTINNSAMNAIRDRILSYCYHIVWKQDTGYTQYFDAATGRFRMAYQFNANGTGQFAGYMDRVFNEFRPGLIWLASFKPAYRSAVEKLDVAIRTFETADGNKVDNAVTFDGGAFQMFWPLLHVDETKYAEFDVALKNFLYTQADYVAGKGIPGLISAGADPGKGYSGKMGVPDAAETADPLESRVGSIYGTASAFLLAPHYTLQFLKNIETAFPGVRSAIGFVDSLRIDNVSTVDPVTGKVIVSQKPVYAQQYYGVDQAGFLLSLLGTSRSYFDNYLTWQGKKQSFDEIYKSMVFGLAPVTSSNPAAPDFGNPVKLLAGQDSDGHLSPLIKQPAFIRSLHDQDFGDGQIYDYRTPSGQFHHTEIEFQDRKLGFQQYILMPGRSELARSLTEALRLDLINEGNAQGVFYTPQHGYSSGALSIDPEVGEIHKLEYQFQNVHYPVGLWTKFDGGLDLTRYDYFSVPVKLGDDAKAGMRIKFEFKGMGEIFITPDLTDQWQYLQIPIVKPAERLTELAVVVQTPDGLPASGTLLVGPLSAIKTRSSNQLDWALLSGYSDLELRNLLKQKALEQPASGGKISAEQTLENFSMDSTGKLIEGTLKRADGGIQYFHKGRLSKWVFRDGRTVLFEKGLATFILDLSRGQLKEGRYYYDQDFRGSVKSFVLQDNDSKKIYGVDGTLRQIIMSDKTINFKDGQMETITTAQGILSGLVFGDDMSLLNAHVKTLTGEEFDIRQGGEQMIQRPGGIKVYYNDHRITAIETPGNGKTTFTYLINSIGQLMGVDATFKVEITNPSTGQQSITEKTMTLFEYLQIPERGADALEILRESPRSILTESAIGGFSLGQIAPGEMTYGFPFNENGAKAVYRFRYNTTNGSSMGMFIDHKNNPVSLSDYDFIQVIMRQDAAMTWNQDLQISLKSPQLAPLYTFQSDNVSNMYKTVAFSLAGKVGREGQTTIELARRESEGVGKNGVIYFKDVSYVSVKKLTGQLWEGLLSMTAKDIQALKKETLTLATIGSEIVKGQSLVYRQLTALQDLPTWVTYAQKTSNEASQLTSFKRFDGSEVTLQGSNVSKIVLSDGTVNEYSASAQTTGSQAGQIAVSGLNDCGAASDCSATSSGNLNYNYGALRKVTQTDGHELSFSYEFDANGNEITVIHDSVTGDSRRFKDGKLIQSLSSDQRETTYRYEQGRIAAAEIMYKNRVLDSTRYTYTTEETQVTDERGTTWYYDANGELIKHLTRDGYLYRYTSVSHELENAQTFSSGDYKNKLLAAQDLQAVQLAGYEATDGSQLIFEADQENRGEVHLADGTQGVNFLFDENQKIKSGQIQFLDGLILEIENYLPRRGRMQNGSTFDISLPSAESVDLLQGTQGVYAGARLKINGRFYTYDSAGHLIQFETTDGRTDVLTYTLDSTGKPSAYNVSKKQQISFRGMPYPKPVELKVEKSTADTKVLHLMDSGQEIISKDGAGFIVGVYKAATNQWDVVTGTFASISDRLTLKNFLKAIKNGESMATVVSDASFSAIDEETRALFESMGAGGIRQAAAQTGTNAWGYYGMKGLKIGDGIQKLASGSDVIAFSTNTETAATVSLPAAGTGTYEGQEIWIQTPKTVQDSFSSFLQSYEKLKIQTDMQKTSVYNDAGDLVFSRRMDGVVSYYELGKIRETFSASGQLLYVHEYVCKDNLCTTGDAMQLGSIRLVKARADFAAESSRLREQVEQAKFDALYKISTQDEESRLRIKEIVQDGLSAIDNQISSLESQRYQDVKQCSRKWYGAKKCKHYTVEVPGVQDAINNLRSQRANLLATQEAELVKIPGGVAAKKTEIETATQTQIADIRTREEEFLTDILRNEIEPVVTDYYRRILGRDLSGTELDTWVTGAKPTAKINIPQLEAALNGSPEKQTRENQKGKIIQEVQDFLNSYLTASADQKTALRASLKLGTSEVIDLARVDADKILNYLKTCGLHFGQSAFNSLREMLASKGAVVSLETIGRETILIDVLTGVINPFTDGELLLSLFSLSRTAAIHTADFSAVKYDFNDLQNSVIASPAGAKQSPVIAHIGEDHYVVVTKVTDTEVSYRETDKGPRGEEIKISKDEFLKVWSKEDGRGYLLVDKTQVREDRKISLVEAQKIRGAFFPLIWLFYAAIVLSIASAVVSTFSPTLGRILGIAAMVAGVVGVVASLGNLVLSGLKMAFNFVSAVAQQGVINTLKAGFVGLTKILLAPVHYVGRFISGGFSFLKQSFQTGLAKLGSGLTKLKNLLLKPQGRIIFDIHHNEVQLFTNHQIAARQLLGVVMGAGGSKVLEGLGVNPVIANLATAFVSGGFTSTGGAMSGFLKSGLQHLIMQGVSEIGLKIGLPPPISGVLSSLAGASLKAWFDPQLNLKQSLKGITPQITGQLALSGMELIGRSLGISPILSKLIGLPFASGLAGLVGGISYGIKGTDLFSVIKQTVVNGTTTGLLSMSAGLALDQLGLSSRASEVITNYLGRLLAGAEAGGSAIAEAGKSLVDKIGDGIGRFGSIVKQGIGHVVSFGEKVLQQTGQFTAIAFKKTLGLFAPLLGRKTQEAVYQDLAGISQGAVSTKGNIWTWQAGTDRVMYDADLDQLFDGDFGITGTANITRAGFNENGGLTYSSLIRSEAISQDVSMTQVYQNGLLRDIRVYYRDTEVFEATGKPEIGIRAENGELISKDIKIYQPIDIPLPPDFDKPNLPDIRPYLPVYVKFETDKGWIVDADFIIEKKIIPESNKELYVLTNGILNPEPSKAPEYLSNLEEDIVEQSKQKVSVDDVLLAHTFNAVKLLDIFSKIGLGKTLWNTILGKLGGPVSFIAEELISKMVGFSVNLSKDLASWVAETAAPHTHANLATDIRTAIEAFFKNSVKGQRNRGIVAVGFSGGFLPLVEVLQNEPKQEGVDSGYKTKSVVALGAATRGVEELMCNRKVIMSAFRNLEMSSIMPHTKGVRHEKRGDNFSEKQGIKEVKSS